MAEGREERVELLTTRHNAIYAALVTLFSLMPVPVYLPDADAIEAGAEVGESVLHAASIVFDLPIPALLGSALHGAAMHWLAVIDPIAAYIQTGDNVRYAGADFVLGNAEDEVSIAMMLMLEERRREQGLE